MTKELLRSITTSNEVRIGIDGHVNEYPSVYLTYRAITSSSVDLVNSVIYEDGCTALELGVGNIYNDVEHNDFFNKSQSETQKARSAGGDVTRVWLEDNKLMAESRVGHEHVITNEKGEVTGSTYASAWLRYAQEETKTKGGNFTDYIPENIYKEFFQGKQVYPIKAISVEIPFEHYKAENGWDLTRSVLHIRKFDLTRISFLLFSTPAQTASGIESISIRKLEEKTMSEEIKNKPTMKNLKNKSIRCLCDYDYLSVDTYLIDETANELFKIVGATTSEDESTDSYTIENILTGEQMTKTLEELKANEALDTANTMDVLEYVIDNIINKDTNQDTLPPQTKSLLRFCQSCSKKNKSVRADEEIKADMPAVVQEPVPADDQTNNDLTVVNEKITELMTIINNLTSRIEALEATPATRSLDEESEEEEATEIADDEPPVIVPVDEAEITLTDTVEVATETIPEIIAENITDAEPEFVRGQIRSVDFKTMKPIMTKGFVPLKK